MTAGTALFRELGLAQIIDGRQRLTPAAALHLYHHAPLHDLGRWATAVADRWIAQRYPDTPAVRTYVIDRNINYTNVCSAHCTFCAFKRDLNEEGAYTLTRAQLHAKIDALVKIGGTQVLLQGGMHPQLPITFYEDMLRGIKQAFPAVHVHGFSPPEFVEFIAVFELEGFPAPAPGAGKSHELPPDVWAAKLEAIMRRLMAAGLDSIPGGGGEIFNEPIRRRIGIGKASATQWLDVMKCAHRLGMSTSATMMFGHIEGVADRIDHMARVRAAQDQAITQGWPGRYVSFIAWPFQRENTPLGRLREWDREDPDVPIFPGENPDHPLHGKRLRSAGAVDYLRTQALARLFLDNVYSIGSSWVTMGPKIGQLALFHGATDMGSVMMEENVVSAAGTTYCLREELLCHLIRTAGFTPAQRDNTYRLLKVHDQGGPDRHVTDWSTQRAAKLHIQSAPAPAPGNGAAAPVSLTVSRQVAR
jgi:cyclic dehypoxanthinyl futalosine synthase